MKRAVDIFGAVIALIALAPLFIVVAITVRLQLGSPIFFHQVRPGRDAKPFRMTKFRTMRDAVDPRGVMLSDADRLTPLGRALRATSLDELPEFWNVLVGDMSLVGPRPLLMAYLPLYSPEQSRRHRVRPGITGWAQVNGRNALSWDEKFAADSWYVDNQSFALDLRIMAMTVIKVVKRDGIAAEGEATMPMFTGNGGNDPA